MQRTNTRPCLNFVNFVTAPRPLRPLYLTPSVGQHAANFRPTATTFLHVDFLHVEFTTLACHIGLLVARLLTEHALHAHCTLVASPLLQCAIALTSPPALTMAACARRLSVLVLVSFFFLFSLVSFSLVSHFRAARSTTPSMAPASNTASDPARPRLRFSENRRLRRNVAVPSDLPDPGPVAADDVRRGPGGPWLDGGYTYYCGIFNTGIPRTIRRGALGLRDADDTFTTPGRSCYRVYCYDTSAVYVCNDADSDLTVTGNDLGWMTDRLATLCCDANHALSAQIFHPTDAWNVVVGYGNCNHDPAQPPSTFGTANGGVNGDCIPNESRPPPGGPS